MRNSGVIWIQGAGELASGVGMRLARCGYCIVMAEIENPVAVRRLVAFSEAVYTGTANVEGVPGVLVDKLDFQLHHGKVQVLVDPQGEHLKAAGAAAVIDGRMTKKAPQPLPFSGELSIGLGPGFQCGRDADIIIETHRGARLGEVIRQGEAASNTGTPGVVGGQSAKRVVYATAAGKLVSELSIGDLVEEGQMLGSVGGEAIYARLTGKVRGLVHPQAELSDGEKVGDIDPRGAQVNPALVTDKALAIGGGILEALLGSGVLPVSD